MKKIRNLLIAIMLMTFVNIVKVNAFSINASSSVYLNSTVAVKIEAKGLTGRFDVTSSNESVLAGSDSKWIEDGTITMYFTAKSVGKATITVNAVEVTDNSYNDYVGSRSITINVIKKTTKPSIDVNKTYSKNNYLKGLSINNYDLNPVFDKEVLEYNVQLEPGTEKVTVDASVEDQTASVKGVGEVVVSEGVNTLNIIVTAENGNERTYKIVATVEEKDPIDVNINGQEYRVVKKKELLDLKDGYKEDTVKIKTFDVPAIYNEVTDVTLIGLKNKEGNIEMFSYNSKTGEYGVYNEFKFDLMNLYIKEKQDSEYEKVKLKINGIETVGYKLDGVEDYYLVYATNTNTGYEGYYLYDSKENSVQRYTTVILDKVTETKDKFLSMVIVLSCVCFLAMLFLLIEVNRDNKRKIEE